MIEDGSGGVSLTKLGTGTFTLVGVNTYTGNTNIVAGTLQLAGANNRLNSATSVDVSANAKFDLNGQSQTISGLTGAGTVASSTGTPTLTISYSGGIPEDFSGVLQDGLNLTKAGTGVQYLSGSTANTYTGVTTVTGGYLVLNKSAGVTAVSGSQADHQCRYRPVEGRQPDQRHHRCFRRRDP